MQNAKVLIGFLCLFSGYVAASPAAADKDVAQAVDHLTQAMLHKNIPQLQALTADNLTYGHSSGKIQNKQEFIADIETGRSGYNTTNRRTLINASRSAAISTEPSARRTAWGTCAVVAKGSAVDTEIFSRVSAMAN